MSKKVVKKKPKIKTMLDTLPRNHGEWLEVVIKLTQRAVDKGVGGQDKQLAKLKQELTDWKTANP